MLYHRLRQYICFSIAKHRRTALIRFLAAICNKILMYYENLNYDPYTNGEEFILEGLSKEEFSCIFDVGANVGEWTLMANSIFPSATIHSFEIAQSTFEQMRFNTKNVPNLIANNSGLSDKEGVVKFRYFPDNSTHSTMTEYPHDYDYITTTGRVITGDSYINKHNIERVNFLKIDVEGAEHLVLRGLSGAIHSRKIDVIQFEYGKVNIITKFLLRDFYEFFQNHDYIVGKVYPDYVDFRNYELTHEDFIGPNYLAIRKEQYDWIHLLA